jgi:hypothetical protein
MQVACRRFAYRSASAAAAGAPQLVAALLARVRAAHAPTLLLHSAYALCRSYSSWMHGIDEVSEDTIDSSLSNLHLTSFASAAEQPVLGFSLSRGTRVSLTIRHVPKAPPPAPASSNPSPSSSDPPPSCFFL